MKFKKIGIIVTLIFVLLFIGLKYRWKPVKWGLSPISAYQSVMSHEGIIVNYEDAGFYYWNGMKKENVTLIGRVPFYEFKTDTLFDNTFFLKGKIQKELSDFYRETVFDVEDWKIVFPIRRQYNLSYQDGRFFYPELYIDEFDVTNNDFQIIHHTEKVISNYEAMYFHIQFPEEYCIVTPENDEGIIKWHVVTEFEKFLPFSWAAGRSCASPPMRFNRSDPGSPLLRSKVPPPAAQRRCCRARPACCWPPLDLRPESGVPPWNIVPSAGGRPAASAPAASPGRGGRRRCRRCRRSQTAPRGACSLCPWRR